MASTPASASAVDRQVSIELKLVRERGTTLTKTHSTTTQSKPTLLTLPSEIRTIIWKFSQLSPNSRSLEMTDCFLIQQLGVCDGSCEKDTSRQFCREEILPLPLCPLLLINHQTRSETLPIEQPHRTIHYCTCGWQTQLLDALTVAQRSLVNRIRLTITLDEDHMLDKDELSKFAERWVTLVQGTLRRYYGRVEVISQTVSAEENLLPKANCIIPEWQIIRMELGAEKARETRCNCVDISSRREVWRLLESL